MKQVCVELHDDHLNRFVRVSLNTLGIHRLSGQLMSCVAVQLLRSTRSNDRLGSKSAMSVVGLEKLLGMAGVKVLDVMEMDENDE